MPLISKMLRDAPPKPWGFMFSLAGYPAGKPVAFTHEVVFSRADPAEMPPVITIQSPGWDARWLDEKGEVPKYKIRNTVKLAASAVNSDGSPVPDKDVSWQIHLDPWWKTPAVTLQGGHMSYTLPEVANEEDKTSPRFWFRDLRAYFHPAATPAPRRDSSWPTGD